VQKWSFYEAKWTFLGGFCVAKKCQKRSIDWIFDFFFGQFIEKRTLKFLFIAFLTLFMKQKTLFWHFRVDTFWSLKNFNLFDF
jgi:hypothetical protein